MDKKMEFISETPAVEWLRTPFGQRGKGRSLVAPFNSQHQSGDHSWNHEG